MKYFSILLISLLLFNCKEQKTETPNADEIIKKSIALSGVDGLNNATLSFDFRDKHYVAERQQGNFDLQRQFKDSMGVIQDNLNNKGFQRYINDSLVTMSDSLSNIYAASVNSVHYFAVLPYGLDGKAVIKDYLNDVEMNGQTYHKLKITFNADGGGEDHEDEFIYWVNAKTSKIDFMAYSYAEDMGIGLRFREAFNERYVDGVRFVDYNNYKPKDSIAVVENLDQLFMESKLDLLSKIELKNIIIN